MNASLPPPRSTHYLLRALTVVTGVAGGWVLGNALLAADAYALDWQWRRDLVAGSVLLLAALGLVTRRRWALDLTLALLYLAFVVILFTLSLGYVQAATPWWYWLLPLALPALGLAAQRLHALRRGMAGRHW